MSIRNSLLALLAEQPMYGAQLKAEFENRTDQTWPLNIGQVYTTLNRLERDGLVEGAGEPDADGRIPYRLTESGREEVQAWWAHPVAHDATPPRDELPIKLAMAVTSPGVDVRAIISTQRSQTLTHLRELNKKKPRRTLADKTTPAGPAELVLEAQIFSAEAQLRWLDYAEERLMRR